MMFPVTHALKRLGANLKDARRRRRIKSQLMADRLGVTRTTLKRMEDGLPGVGIGVYATAIYALDPGKLDVLADILSREKDTLGQIVSDRALPKRIRGTPRI
jgi:DNA-binding XRE family transcriptional regulator